MAEHLRRDRHRCRVAVRRRHGDLECPPDSGPIVPTSTAWFRALLVAEDHKERLGSAPWWRR
jgi:hypothetical protein